MRTLPTGVLSFVRRLLEATERIYRAEIHAILADDEHVRSVVPLAGAQGGSAGSAGTYQRRSIALNLHEV